VSGFDYPDGTPLAEPSGVPRSAWNNWFSRVHTIAISAQQSGTTANRPDSVLWIGRRYFDTTLGKPVYVKSVKPAVWVDGVGVVS
jgi:hypothetical protein